ncbi:MAG: MFS transporter [Zoogloeaceae bacterium]|nr:MFS transporter [Zoogloeaceae bacterium]
MRRIVAVSIRIAGNPGFLAFLLARFAGMFATQIQAIAVAWQVYDETRDPMALAWVGLAQFLPMLAFLIPAGDLIDRRARKPILMVSWIVAMFCAVALWWLSAGPMTHRLSGIYAVLFCFGCSRAFSGPTLQSLLPQIVPREQLSQAIATNGMLMRAASIGGPLVGGFLHAWGGARVTYIVCALGFALGTFCLLRVQTPHAGPRAVVAADSTLWRRFRVGICFIFRRPVILGSISLDLFAVLLGGVVALLPIYARDILHTGADGLGLLRSAIATGEICAGLYLSMHPLTRSVGRALFVAVVVFGLANLVFALSSLFWLSFGVLAVAGAADMVSVYIRSALVQYATPDDMRGRVSAVNMLFIGSSNELGEFRAGVSAAWLGPTAAAILGSLCTLGVVALWTRWFQPLYQVDHFNSAGDDFSHASSGGAMDNTHKSGCHGER